MLILELSNLYTPYKVDTHICTIIIVIHLLVLVSKTSIHQNLADFDWFRGTPGSYVLSRFCAESGGKECRQHHVPGSSPPVPIIYLCPSVLECLLVPGGEIRYL